MSIRGTTPGRLARENDRRNALNERSRQENETKHDVFLGQCEAGSVESCNSLGEWFVLMRSDYRAAAKLYTPACLEKRHPQACLNLGNLLRQGKLDFDRPLSLAARVLGMGCDAGSGAACAEGGALFLKEAGLFKRSNEGSGTTEPVPLEQPLARAASLLDRGCRGGDTVDNAKSCGLLGALMLHERAPLAALATVGRSDKQGAVALLERACEREDPGACLNLARLYASGNPVLGLAADPVRTAELRKRASLLHGLSPEAADALLLGSSGSASGATGNAGAALQ